MPVTFTNRTLKANELNYSTVETEVPVSLRILKIFFTMLVNLPLKVLTRHSTLVWVRKLCRFAGAVGKLVRSLIVVDFENREGKKGEDKCWGSWHTVLHLEKV